jgi:DNA-binding beta-propeller fold protein YncE
VPVGPGPYAVVFNPANQRVYVGLAGGTAIRVLDARGEIQSTIELGGLGLVQGLAINAKTNRVYAVYFVSPRLHAVAEVDGAADRIIARYGGDYAYPLTEAYGIAVDETHNRVFVGDARGLVQIDPTARRITRVNAMFGFGYAFGMVYDSRAGQVIRGGTLRQSLAVTVAP